MNQDEKYYDFHFFVCTNEKDKGKGCAERGGAKLFSELKDWSKKLSAEELNGKKIRINKAGCLNRCSEGVACVAYPNNEWLVDVDGKDDAEKVQKKILKMLRD